MTRPDDLKWFAETADRLCIELGLGQRQSRTPIASALKEAFERGRQAALTPAPTTQEP